MVKAFVNCLAEGHRQHLFVWNGARAAIVASHEELGNKSVPLRQGAVMEGIAIFDVAGGR